jgi:hypothetical protein
MSGRGKYKSMGASYREGQNEGGGGRGRGRGNRFRKTLNGNYIKQGGEDNNDDSTRPQVSSKAAGNHPHFQGLGPHAATTAVFKACVSMQQ